MDQKPVFDEEGRIVEKAILIGPADSGKSSLLLRMTADNFQPNHDQTIGVEFGSKIAKVNIKNKDHQVKLQIWDTAGEEYFRSITRAYYRGTKIAIFCIKMNDGRWPTEVNKWVSAVRQLERNAKIVFVATRSDDTTGTNYKEEMQKYATQNGYPFFVASAKEGTYIDTDGNEKNIHNDFGNSLAEVIKDDIARDLGEVAKAESGKYKKPHSTGGKFGLFFTGIGFLMFMFAFLTFPPFHLIPQPAVSVFLALFGGIFSLVGAIALMATNWFSNNWEAGNKGRVVAFMLAALILAATLITFFALSVGPYAELFSDTFADYSGFKLISQIALGITAISFLMGFAVGLYQARDRDDAYMGNAYVAVSEGAPGSSYYEPSGPQYTLANTASVPSTSAVSSDTPGASDSRTVSHRRQ